jgi:alpha/beta superfamily hydrolase
MFLVLFQKVFVSDKIVLGIAVDRFSFRRIGQSNGNQDHQKSSEDL